MTDQDLPTGWATTTLADICLPVDKVAPESEPDKEFIYLN